MKLDKQNAGVRETTSNGFTLIELMIVVAIVGILAAVAYPSYANYVTRGKITEAHSLLADYRIRIEQHYQDNRNYDGTNCGTAVPTSQYFTFACAPGTSPAQTYTATAQGTGNLGGYSFTINELNAKATTSFPGVSGSKPCWLVKGSEC